MAVADRAIEMREPRSGVEREDLEASRGSGAAVADEHLAAARVLEDVRRQLRGNDRDLTGACLVEARALGGPDRPSPSRRYV
jgi:hypothetical protein